MEQKPCGSVTMRKYSRLSILCVKYTGKEPENSSPKPERVRQRKKKLWRNRHREGEKETSSRNRNEPSVRFKFLDYACVPEHFVVFLLFLFSCVVFWFFIGLFVSFRLILSTLVCSELRFGFARFLKCGGYASDSIPNIYLFCVLDRILGSNCTWLQLLRKHKCCNPTIIPVRVKLTYDRTIYIAHESPTIICICVCIVNRGMYYRRNIIVRLQTPSERENSFRSETERTRSPNRVVILAHCITSR